MDSDATEPLPDRNAFSSENTTEQAVEASQNTTEQAVEASQNTTEQAVEASLAQISLGQESLSPKRPSESASHALSLEEQQIVPPSLPQTSTAEASEEPEPNEQVAEYQQTDPSLQVVETSNREEDPVPEPEPPKPRTPSPPPIPKAKVSFAAFMKRRKDNPEPSKPKSSEGDTDPMNQPDAAQHPLDSRAPIESTAFGSVSMAEPARQMSKSAEDDDGPQYRPASPMYRPSSPPLTTHLVGDSAPTSSYLPMVKHEIDPDAPSRPYLPGRESLNLAGTEATSYFPSAPSSHYEPIPRSSNMRSPSPSATRPLPSPAPSMRSRRSPSPPPTGRWPPPPAASHGDPPTGPRLSSGFNRWPPRGRGRGYGQFPNYERPPPPRAPRAFGSAPTMPQRSFWPSRSGPPADRERSVYQGAPRGPRTRGSPWRGRGR